MHVIVWYLLLLNQSRWGRMKAYMAIRNYFQAHGYFHSVSVFDPCGTFYLSLCRSISHICEKYSFFKSLHCFFTITCSVIAWENVNKNSLGLHAVNGFIRILLGLKEFPHSFNFFLKATFILFVSKRKRFWIHSYTLWWAGRQNSIFSLCVWIYTGRMINNSNVEL